MRGLTFILGFVIGNDKARNWCIEQMNKASRVLESEFKKTPLGKKLKEIGNNDDTRRENEPAA